MTDLKPCPFCGKKPRRVGSEGLVSDLSQDPAVREALTKIVKHGGELAWDDSLGSQDRRDAEYLLARAKTDLIAAVVAAHEKRMNVGWSALLAKDDTRHLELVVLWQAWKEAREAHQGAATFPETVRTQAALWDAEAALAAWRSPALDKSAAIPHTSYNLNPGS